VDKYFYIKNNKRLGPFSIAQLNNENIKKNTLVWKEGLEDWVKASELIELKEVIIPEPPPIPKPPPIPNKPLLSKVVKKDIYDPDYKKEIWVTDMVIFYIIVVGLITYFNYPFSESYLKIVSVYTILIRILAVVIIKNLANRQNRDVLRWGVFCFFMPQLALFIIGLQKKLKLKINFKPNWSNDQKKISLINKGEKFLDKYRYKEVVVLMNKLLELFPENEKGLSFRAEAYYEINNYDKALIDYQTLVSISKDKKLILKYEKKIKSLEQKKQK